jgi:hypothetical protein
MEVAGQQREGVAAAPGARQPSLFRRRTRVGVPRVTLSPGVFAVEEADLTRFLVQQQNEPDAPPPKPRPRLSDQRSAESSAARAHKRKQ